MSPLERAWRGTRNDWRLHLLGVFSVAVAFVCLAASMLLVVNVDGVRQRWADNGRASVYLKPTATQEQVAVLDKALRETEGVVAVKLVTHEDARREVLANGGDDVLAS